MTDTSADSSPEEHDDDEPHFLADPDVAGAFERMLDEFSRETDRGSILIAADTVSAHLERIILALAPETFTAKRVKGLLNYPGPLSTFAARADIAFMAGFIGENAHRSIDLLRGLRNKAAHSQGAFSLADHRKILRGICDLGPGTAAGVNRFAVELILRSVVDRLLGRGVELEAEIGSNPFASPSDIIDELSARPEHMKLLEDRLPRMELAFGIWILLGLITHQKKAMVAKRLGTAAKDDLSSGETS
ncbi:hypothetical protein ACFPOB_12555 [Bosea eneae]|uniref:Mannitol repressor n=1 Tax=Bosea eneae TaxID=151454 RepID=A0ABW0ITS2_9HYPH